MGSSRYIRSHLKKRILVQDQGVIAFQSADIRQYFKYLEHGPNAEIGTKDVFATLGVGNPFVACEKVKTPLLMPETALGPCDFAGR